MNKFNTNIFSKTQLWYTVYVCIGFIFNTFITNCFAIILPHSFKYGPSDAAIMPLGMDAGYPAVDNHFAKAVQENAYHILKNSVAYKKRSTWITERCL